MDADGDGIPDAEDAFPTDPAASRDTDGDGYPDLWNPGKTEADSTSGLKLDEYPLDPGTWKKEETEGSDENGDEAEFLPGFETIGFVFGIVVIMLLRRRRKKGL